MGKFVESIDKKLFVDFSYPNTNKGNFFVTFLLIPSICICYDDVRFSFGFSSFSNAWEIFSKMLTPSVMFMQQ